ncbi:hypothetical protein HAX54_037755, partial [Datura stramonium]|nr:hypothetical protein [Datura stramonium]
MRLRRRRGRESCLWCANEGPEWQREIRWLPFWWGVWWAACHGEDDWGKRDRDGMVVTETGRHGGDAGGCAG